MNGRTGGGNCSLNHGDASTSCLRRENAERFIEEVRGDEPEIAAKLRIEERGLDAGDVN